MYGSNLSKSFKHKQQKKMGNSKNKVKKEHWPPLYDPETPAFTGTIDPFENMDAINASDILRVVLKFLSFRSAARVSLVCKDFNGIVRNSEQFWENILAHLFLYHDTTAKPMLQLVYDADKSITAQNRNVEHKGNDIYKITREFFQYQSLQKYKTARETVIAFAKYIKVIQTHWTKVQKRCEKKRKRQKSADFGIGTFII